MYSYKLHCLMKRHHLALQKNNHLSHIIGCRHTRKPVLRREPRTMHAEKKGTLIMGWLKRKKNIQIQLIQAVSKLGRYHDIIEYRDTNLETISISDRFCINRNIGKSQYRLSIAMYFLAETSCDNKSHSGDNLTSSLKSCESPAVCDSHRRNRKIPLQIGPTGFLWGKKTIKAEIRRSYTDYRKLHLVSLSITIVSHYTPFECAAQGRCLRPSEV